jgi:hypothetical protein
MTDLEQIAAWIDGYKTAWRSNDEGDIAALFTADATYRTEPHAEPWRGRDEIVRRWLARRDTPGEADFHWQPVASNGDLSVVQGETAYPDRTYSNLWLFRLDERGACTEFTEWWMEQPRP